MRKSDPLLTGAKGRGGIWGKRAKGARFIGGGKFFVRQQISKTMRKAKMSDHGVCNIGGGGRIMLTLGKKKRESCKWYIPPQKVKGGKYNMWRQLKGQTRCPRSFWKKMHRRIPE